MIIRSSEVLGMYGDGCFDSQGRIVRAWTDAPGTEPNLVVDREGGGGAWETLFRVHPASGILMQRIAISPRGVVCVIGQTTLGNDCVLWLSTCGFVTGAGACTTRPIVRWDGNAFDLAIPASGSVHARWRISEDGLSVSVVTESHAPTSSGFTHFAPDGRPVTFDEVHG
jgi:hypothetical protein